MTKTRIALLALALALSAIIAAPAYAANRQHLPSITHTRCRMERNAELPAGYEIIAYPPHHAFNTHITGFGIPCPTPHKAHLDSCTAGYAWYPDGGGCEPIGNN